MELFTRWSDHPGMAFVHESQQVAKVPLDLALCLQLPVKFLGSPAQSFENTVNLR